MGVLTFDEFSEMSTKITRENARFAFICMMFSRDIFFVFFQISLKTVLKPNIDDGNAMPIEISLHANSSNPELTTSLDDNKLDLNIPVYVETDFVIRGLSDPDPLSHNASAYPVPRQDIRHESEIGKVR